MSDPSRAAQGTEGDALLGQLMEIARAMTTVRDVDRLLGLILEKSRFVTGADAGSIYIVESQGERPTLRFKLTQNDSVTFDSREFTMPLSERSIAGSAALRRTAHNIPDVYALGAGSTFHFDPTFDRRTGYMTCGYSATGPDGTCHSPPNVVCSIPCEASTDCTALGGSAVCTSACGGAPICVPFQ